MERKNRVCENPFILAVAAALLAANPSVFASGDYSEPLAQLDVVPLTHLALPAAETSRRVMAPRVSRAEYSSADLRQALANFVRQIKGSRRAEDEALAVSLSGWIRAAGFDREVRRAQAYGIPIELFHFAPQVSPESSILQEFSEAFRFPLQFDSSRNISSYAITVSLDPMPRAVHITVQSGARETNYLVGLKDGSVISRKSPAD